ncbi:DUF4132 domain-containing protein [Streptomyces albus subsp. chlorinus]|uniref:DUF4132 domain-containing protein n=1 Tax=Streptomyces albus TaxID=1888 RepID=UPI00237B026E|nr:DUF4132 domain-containing protein [Streptomyces albus]
MTCRKTDGRVLKSVPGAVRTSRVGRRFAALQEQLAGHEKECRAAVESWLLGGVPIPARLLARIWPDPSWRTGLRHLVVRAGGRAGLLQEVSEDGRARIRELDGAPYEPPVGSPVTLVHPALLDDPAAWQRLLEEHGGTQAVEQLSRSVHRQREGNDPAATGIGVEADEDSGQYWSTRSRAAEHGFGVRGGFAVLRITERGVTLEARCRLGSGEPGAPAEPGRLMWVDEAERPVPLGEVGPVAWSEGRRMAELVYGAPARRGAEDR